MVDRVHVQNFQSLADVTLDLGRFTVIVGPSNSGKSGLLRAVRGCLRNTVVPANVRQGTTSTKITVNLDPTHSVEIERGKSLSTYKIHDDQPGGQTHTYTKSGRTVPDDVAKIIGLPHIAGTDTSFAFQFDKPYLLAEPGSLAAQVIGSLTNVSLLHAAIREANRRRQEASGVHKTRQGDAERYREQIETYRHLPQRHRTLTDAETRLRAVQADQDQLRRLSDTLDRVLTLTEQLRHQPQPPVDVSDLVKQLHVTIRSHRELTRTLARVTDLQSHLVEAVHQAKNLKAQAEQARTDRDAYLHDLGACPVCGQPVLVDVSQPQVS